VRLDEILNRDNNFKYQLLGRLQQDCEYYLGYGNRNPAKLWAGNEKEQIQLMFELYKSFKRGEKPNWISLEKIRQYERKMGLGVSR
jgi:hypothetical protein